MICTDAVCSITLNEAPVGFLIPISFKMPDQVEVASVRILGSFAFVPSSIDVFGCFAGVGRTKARRSVVGGTVGLSKIPEFKSYVARYLSYWTVL